MGRRKTMPELRDILRRLKLGQSKRTIQKETGTHRTIIREMEKLAVEKGWLNSEKLPEEGEILKCREGEKSASGHPLDAYRDYIRELIERKLSYVVIHRLISEKHTCDESTLRRYVKKNLPESPTAVNRRKADAGIM